MFQKFSIYITSLILITSLISSFVGFAVNAQTTTVGFDFTHLANTLPVNTVSDGSVSVCITNITTGERTSLFQIAKEATVSMDFVAGQYTVLVTSLTRSSLDGSVMDPCTSAIFGSPTHWTYSAEIRDGFRTKIDFVGTGSVVDPRLNPAYGILNPLGVINQGGTGMVYFNFKDYIVDENGVRQTSPLGTLNKICMDNGAVGPILMDLTPDPFGGSLNLFQNVGLPQGGMRFFPPLTDGTCGTQDIWTTPFTQSIELIFEANQDYRVIFDSALQVSGFDLVQNFVAVTSDVVIPVEQPVSSSSSSSTTTVTPAPVYNSARSSLITVRTGGGN